MTEVVTKNHSNFKVVAYNKRSIIRALRPHGIHKVVVEYYGGGDSGGVETVRLESEDGGDLPVPSGNVSYAAVRGRYNMETFKYDPVEVHFTVKTLSDALEEFAMDLVEKNHCGWENNDGGRGDVTFYVADKEIVNDHEEYYTESNSYSHSF